MSFVGIEMGGTFTDLVSIEGGRISFAKVPSVPGRPDQGALDAIRAADLAIDAIAELVHGSTVATNAVLQRSGAKVAFITTHGFRDLLFIQRHDRERVYDIRYAKPAPICGRSDCFEVPERMLPSGIAAQPLDAAYVLREVVPTLVDRGYQAVAICLLNAYKNPAHEIALKDALQAHLPGVYITLSSDITRAFREYERASSTVIAAHVRPIVASYLERLTNALNADGFSGRLSLMQSNGGCIPVSAMQSNPLTALFSGPAAGVVGAIHQAALSGYKDIITFDMGGTSTDVCLVDGGVPEIKGEAVIDGLPIKTPMFDIVSVGAGCGSVVWLDPGGMVRAGPRSAGADPGPACYGKGGTEATITDAHVVRGSIRPEAFLGGQMAIDGDRARQAFASLAAELDLSIEKIAGIAIRINEAATVRAVQLISTQKGKDPREYVMVAYGGAGPLHAANVAAELGINRVLVPAMAGVMSAYGLLASDYRFYETRSERVAVNENCTAVLRSLVDDMSDSSKARVTELGFAADAIETSVAFDMRYVGQAFEITVELSVADLEDLHWRRLEERFERSYQEMYMQTDRRAGKAIEVVSIRLGLNLPTNKFAAAGPADQMPAGPQTIPAQHCLNDGDSITRCRLLSRADVAGTAIRGPLIVEDVTSTVYVPAQWAIRKDAVGNLLMECGNHEA